MSLVCRVIPAAVHLLHPHLLTPAAAAAVIATQKAAVPSAHPARSPESGVIANVLIVV